MAQEWRPARGEGNETWVVRRPRASVGRRFPPNLPPMSGNGIRVLLCDDHALVRESLAGLLTGYERLEVVGMAADGAEGVELTARLHPDVVLMDLSMPVMDGVAATRN